MEAQLAINFINFCPCCRSKEIATRSAILSPFFAFRTLGLEPVIIKDDEFRDLGHGTSYQPCKSIYCLNCSSVSCSARFSEEALINYYNGYQDEDFIAMRVHFEPSFAERMKRRSNPNTLRKRGETVSYLYKVENIYKTKTGGELPLNVLDFGGGSGANSLFLETAHVNITDIDKKAFRSHSSRPTQGYDLICLLNVLEHVNSPQHTLTEALSYATPGITRVLIEVPLERFMHNMADEDIYSKKKIWTEHINCFSPYGLELLVKNCGLEPIGGDPVVRITTHENLDSNADENSQALIIVANFSKR
jgi:hypothetical protein